jgi:hypothetical protein
MFVYIFYYTNLVTLADHTDRQGKKQKPITTSKVQLHPSQLLGTIQATT